VSEKKIGKKREGGGWWPGRIKPEGQGGRGNTRGAGVACIHFRYGAGGTTLSGGQGIVTRGKNVSDFKSREKREGKLDGHGGNLFNRKTPWTILEPENRSRGEKGNLKRARRKVGETGETGGGGETFEA